MDLSLRVTVGANITYRALKQEYQVDIDLAGLHLTTCIDGSSINVDKLAPLVAEQAKGWCADNTVGFVKVNSYTLHIIVF